MKHRNHDITFIANNVEEWRIGAVIIIVVSEALISSVKIPTHTKILFKSSNSTYLPIC